MRYFCFCFLFLIGMKFGSNTINKKRTRDNQKDDLFYFFNNLTVENSNPNFPRISWNYVSFGKRCREQVCSIFFEKKTKMLHIWKRLQ